MWRSYCFMALWYFLYNTLNPKDIKKKLIDGEWVKKLQSAACFDAVLIHNLFMTPRHLQSTCCRVCAPQCSPLWLSWHQWVRETPSWRDPPMLEQGSYSGHTYSRKQRTQELHRLQWRLGDCNVVLRMKLWTSYVRFYDIITHFLHNPPLKW